VLVVQRTCNAENPVDLDNLPAVYEAAVLRMLSPELPLEIVVDRVDDEEYWQRRCDLTWDLSKVVKNDEDACCIVITCIPLHNTHRLSVRPPVRLSVCLSIYPVPAHSSRTKALESNISVKVALDRCK